MASYFSVQSEIAFDIVISSKLSHFDKKIESINKVYSKLSCLWLYCLNKYQKKKKKGVDKIKEGQEIFFIKPLYFAYTSFKATVLL